MNSYSRCPRAGPRDSDKYSALSANLISARMAMTPERYTLYGLLSPLCGVVFAIIGFFISFALTMSVPSGYTGIYNVYDITLPNSLIVSLPTEAISFIGAIISFIIGTLLVYFVVMRYPGIGRRNRATKINLTLHNAVAYMYAMRKRAGRIAGNFPVDIRKCVCIWRGCTGVPPGRQGCRFLWYRRSDGPPQADGDHPFAEDETVPRGHDIGHRDWGGPDRLSLPEGCDCTRKRPDSSRKNSSSSLP